jgi:serine/threonine-protein kinase
VVPVYESGEVDGQPYFTMKLVEGGNLATRRADFALPLHKDVARQRALAVWWAKVARAVHHVHERGVLHRDLKPSNILVDLAGEPHVTDFGLAGAVDDQMSQRLTLSGEVMGTPAYMAPEVATDGVKAATVRSDVYGLGIMLYELICGRLPFEGGTPLAVMQAVITQEVTHPSVFNLGVSRDLATIALRSIEKEPQRRYASAEALADDLQRFCAGEPIQARHVGTVERAVKWMRRCLH